VAVANSRLAMATLVMAWPQEFEGSARYYIETAKISYLRRARLAVATQISLWPWPQPSGGCGQIAGGYSQFLAKTTKCITLGKRVDVKSFNLSPLRAI
jgi:hypothetical protein